MTRSGLRWHVLVLGLLACPGPEASHDPLGQRAPWIPSEAECVECHADVAAQWAGSRHHGSFSNPDFQRSYAREPNGFCRDCHAPALARLPAAEAEALGVGCVDCHLDPARTGLLTSGVAGAPSLAPHSLTRTAEFATQTCARCHEFAFPSGSWRPPGTMMQTTMTEHAASSFADRSCAACHMPAHDHGFASTRDDAAIRGALSVVARREGDKVILDLEPITVGHAFPTGDLFRRLELHAEWITSEGLTLATTTRYLGRHFAPRLDNVGRPNPAARQPVPDDRVVGPTTIELEPVFEGEGQATTVVWWVDYERVDHRDNRHPERSTLAGQVRLAGGRL